MTVVPAGLKHLGVGFVDSGLAGEFRLEMLEGAFQRAVEQPADKAQSEDVPAFEHTLVVHAAVGQSGLCHGRNRHLDNSVGIEAKFGDGIVGGIESLAEVWSLERVDVDDHNSVGLEEADVLLQSRGVHGHEDIAGIAGGVDTAAHAYLEAADTAERALRRAYLSRIVGEG